MGLKGTDGVWTALSWELCPVLLLEPKALEELLDIKIK